MVPNVLSEMCPSAICGSTHVLYVLTLKYSFACLVLFCLLSVKVHYHPDSDLALYLGDGLKVKWLLIAGEVTGEVSSMKDGLKSHLVWTPNSQSSV